MAIGTEIDLENMLNNFLHVCIKRLRLISAHVFLYRDDNGWPETRINTGDEVILPEHYLSIPDRDRGARWKISKELQSMVYSVISGNIDKMEINGSQYYGYVLPEHGCLIFHCKQVLETVMSSALLPIMAKLSKSCYASIVHDSLLREVKARKEAEESLRYQATHHQITDLPNRVFLNEMLAAEMARCRRHEIFSVLLYIELNQMRQVKGMLGHEIGEELMRWLAGKLKTLTRRNDLAAHIDEEDFVVLLSHVGDSLEAAQNNTQRIINKIQSVVSEPALIGGHVISVSLSIGYEILSNQSPVSDDFEMIIKHADIAKSEAKLAWHKQGVQFEGEMLDRLNERVEMEKSLQAGLDKQELDLWWQPQYDNMGLLIGAEALLRWNNPRWGRVPPGIFIPMAEESELIVEIGSWVLMTACDQLCYLIKHGIPGNFTKLSINVNARQLTSSRFMNEMIKHTSDKGIPANLLGIELTEGTLVERFEETVQLIEQLRQHGFDCSIDDFGTGYSSLNYLKKLPIKTIKIDQSFVRNLHIDSDNKAIAKALVSLGENLSKDIIAEGVETIEEFDCLVGMGCHNFQGYYFDKPMPFEDLIARWYSNIDDA
ncbi:MAG: putative bifunctional diguanylate cyclase/phosphodiesterase [Gammaproteobacteria bacterium]